MKKHVIFATNSNQDYSFFAPICARMWASLGYHPHVFVVNDLWEHGSKVALAELQKAASVYKLQIPEGYRSSTVAQVSRLLGAMLPVDDADLIMTADVDMLPLNASFFNQHGPNISIFYSNAYEEESAPHFPICYICAPKTTWAELTEVKGNQDELLRHILVNLSPMSNAGEAWGYDEFWISSKLVKHHDYANAKLIPRERFGGMVIRRIDRVRNWNPPPNEADDCHCWRPGYVSQHWIWVLNVILHACPDLRDWAEDYRARFVRQLQKPEPTKEEVHEPVKATPFPISRFVPQSLYRRIG